ncbi:Hypothetical protein NTJ_15441 [Nesidiocoris tenuis]|uniref:Uncharacterized protein n=1 Tax=Nesidiocoris tenuis TaxID=355587 RepID=A0ABN7BHR4_9HEMI|nr:Hypothetical protein NTJ_15441 [Nesidiocoris tenuis]
MFPTANRPSGIRRRRILQLFGIGCKFHSFHREIHGKAAGRKHQSSGTQNKKKVPLSSAASGSSGSGASGSREHSMLG